MKTTSCLLALLLTTPSTFAADGAGRSSSKIASCSVRMSEGDLAATSAASNPTGAGYCVGTLIAPNLIVTAAHCIDDIHGGSAGDLKVMKHGKSFNLAFNSSDSIQKVTVQAGDSSIYASDSMLDGSTRDTYSKTGKGFRTQDLAIIKVDKPIKGFDPAVCPHLPSPTECSQFKDTLHDATVDHPANIQANYYFSKVIDPNQRDKFLPQPSLFAASSKTSKAFGDGTVEMQFSKDGKILHFHKGDSGTGFIMPSANGPTLMGVQTGALKDDETTAVFAPMCSKMNDPRLVQVAGLAAAPQTAAVVPRAAPGTSGTTTQ